MQILDCGFGIEEFRFDDLTSRQIDQLTNSLIDKITTDYWILATEFFFYPLDMGSRVIIY